MLNDDAYLGTSPFFKADFWLKRSVFFFILSFILFVGNQANAYPPNYQRFVLGERALGMGGAYTAAGADPMASYYNPGGLAFASGVMLSVSQNLWSVDYRKIEGGFRPASPEAEDAITMEHSRGLSFPSTLAILVHFGGFKKKGKKKPPKNHTVAFSIITPYDDSAKYSTTWESNTNLRDTTTYRISDSYKIVWTGLSYAYRARKKWGFGVTAYLSDYKYGRDLDVNFIQDWGGEDECGLYRCGYLETRESEFDVRVISMLFRLGVLWQPSRKWRFGLAVTTPNIKIDRLIWRKTKGSLNQTLSFAYVDNTDDDYVEFYTDKYKFGVDERDPLIFRLGAAYLGRKKSVLGFDITLYVPVTASYDRVHGDPVEEKRYPEGPDGPVDEQATPIWVDAGIVRRIKRLPVVNLNLGGEWMLFKQWTVRSGLYSDFSAAPKVTDSSTPQETRVHRIGGTYSIGYNAKGYDLTVGVTGTFGRGKASAYHFEEGESSSAWQPAQYTDYSVYVFIAGIGKVAEKSTKDILKKVEDSQKK